MAIRFLYFDLGNVLVSFCHERMIRQMAAVAEVPEDEMRRLLTWEMAPRTSLHWQMERGELDCDQAYAVLCDELGVKGSQEDLERACSDIFERMEDSLALMTALHGAGHRLGVLSNTNHAHWRWLTSGWIPELRDAFELCITSFEARCVKPDPDIYLLAAKRAEVAPAEVFYTDDRPENIEGALAAGFDAVPFTTIPQLEQDLRARQIAW